MRANLLIIFSIVFMTTNVFSQVKVLQTNLSIKHLVQYPSSYDQNDSTKQYPLIIALHGHGSNEHDLISLASHLQKDLLWVSGRGPSTYDENAYDWYKFNQPGIPEPIEIAKAIKTLNTFIAELIVTYPVNPEKIFLLGFSQGSMISMAYLMAHPEKITGVIALSGYIPPNIGMEINEIEIRNKPIIITHGVEDCIIPIKYGQLNRDTFLKLGLDVVYKEFHMGHSISDESIKAVKNWLDLNL